MLINISYVNGSKTVYLTKIVMFQLYVQNRQTSEFWA